VNFYTTATRSGGHIRDHGRTGWNDECGMGSYLRPDRGVGERALPPRTQLLRA
jgi:hypothetical protein